MLSFFAKRSIFAPFAANSAPAPAPTAKTPAKTPVAKTPTAKTPTAKKPESVLGQDQLKLTPKPAAPAKPPEPILATTPELAIAAALKGDTVKVKVNMDLTARQLEMSPETDSRLLKLRPMGEATGGARYELELGAQKIEVAIAENQAVEASLVRTLRVLMTLPEQLRTPVTGLNIHDPDLEDDAFSLSLANLNGKPGSVDFKRTGTKDGFAVYELAYEGTKIKVQVHEEEDLPWELAKTAAFLSQVPARYRSELKTIIVHNAANPQDAYWATTYKIPNFVSAATAGGGVVNFWNGQNNMSDDIFNHEFGHLLGQRLSNGKSFIPPGWEAAIAADPKAPSSYSSASPTEDFAESWSTLMKLKSGQPSFAADVKNEAEFAQKYPARYKMLQAIYESTAVEETSRSGGAIRSTVVCDCRGCDGPVQKKAA